MKFTGMDLLVEEFYDGHEMDIDILVQNNKPVFIGLTDNFKPHEPYFFETGSVCPSIELNKDEKRAIEKIIGEWIPKLNLQNGLLHFEVFSRPISLYPNRKYDVERPFENIHEFLMPIKMSLRLGGGATWSLNYAAYDVDLFTSYIHLMLGLDLDEKHLEFKQINPRSQNISYNFFPSEIPCRIKNISVEMETIKKSEKILEIGLFTTAGDVCDSKDFIGWMALKESIHSTHNDLNKTMSKCSNLVRHEFDNKLGSNCFLSLKPKETYFYQRDELIAKKNLPDDFYIDKTILMIGSSGVGNPIGLRATANYQFKYKVNLTDNKSWSEYFDDTILIEDIDMSQKEKILDILIVYMKEKNIEFDAVITFYENKVQITSYLASELGCLGVPLEVSKMIQDKHEFRKYSDRLGIVTPEYNQVKSDQRSKQIDLIETYLDSKSEAGEDGNLTNYESDNHYVKQIVQCDLPFIVKNTHGCGKGIFQIFFLSWLLLTVFFKILLRGAHQSLNTNRLS
jgi:hypothetical protein